VDQVIQSQLGNQLVVAAITSFVLQKLKDWQKFPWLTEQSARANRIAAGVLAGLGTIGITVVCVATDRTCTMHYPDAATLATGVVHWAQQFAVLHGWYKLTTTNRPA
jgi:hypothetical protein